jgi:hypothetical protein
MALHKSLRKSPPVANEPIVYDDHGDIPFDVSFEEIRPSDISIYLELDTRVGPSTCRQACSHCFFINQPEAKGRVIDLAEGHRVMEGLIARGYKVFPMISDSLANGGEFLRLFGNSHNREYRQGMDRQRAKTLRRGELWTSGAPLLDDNWEHLLSLGIQHGFGCITLTFHGLLDAELNLQPMDVYPIRHVFPGRDCVRVVERIHRFNRTQRQPFQISLGVTIGAHNCTEEHLLRYVRYFNQLNLTMVRFNSFHDHGWHHPSLPLDDDQTAGVYRILKRIHTHTELNFQMAVDEDFGSSGIEVMEFPAHTGMCRAGRQLFAVVPDGPTTVNESADVHIERIGTVAACVDAFKPICGHLVRTTDKARKSVSYDLDFSLAVIDELNRKRRDGTYRDGCFAKELLVELRPRAMAAVATAEIRR